MPIMRNGGNKIIEALTYTQVHNLIPIIERGLEVAKMEYIASQNEATKDEIDDAETLLTFLYLRKFGN